MISPPEIRHAKTCTCGIELGFVRAKEKTIPVELPAARVYVWNPAAGAYELCDGYVAHFTTCPHADRYRRKQNDK